MRNYIQVNFIIEEEWLKKNNIESFCEAVQDNYKKKGIDNFELAISNNKVISAQTRNVKLENIESSSGVSITLNIMIGI